MKRVILESPFAGDIERNIDYARKCMHDCLMRGEAPYASHLLYTQPKVLDDTNPKERQLGMIGGFAWIPISDYTVVYADYGISGGMWAGIYRAIEAGKQIRIRFLQPTIT
jgi:hypothetical protein